MGIQHNAILSDKDALKLWYRQPAACWQEALPLGNGRMGAMITGNPGTERIALTELTCFSGEAHSNEKQIETYPYFYQAREALLQNDYAQSAAYLQQYLGKRLNYGTHLPLGNLIVQTHDNFEDVSEYTRLLDLNTAVSYTTYRTGDTVHTRTAFLSNPHQLMVMRIGADYGKLNLSFTLAGDNVPHHLSVEGNDIVLIGNAFEDKHSDGASGVSFVVRLHAIPLDGSLEIQNQSIHITNASQVLLLIAVETSFHGKDPKEQCRERIQNTASLTFDALLQSHVQDYQSLFQRVQLYLGDDEALPTDLLLEKVQSGKHSPFLTALLFQYGRYLLISSSRHNSPLPTQLQGVWNDSVACNIGWTCDMHLDINTQMNYWPAEITNLSECHLPLLRWIEQSLVPSGRKTARLFYGLEGWIAELVSNAWGYTNPYWHINLSPCPTGGAWIATHLWEHYLFTQDNDFLQNHAFPIISEAVTFFIGYIFIDPVSGYLTSGPSISPENHFVVDGKTYAASLGPFYEIVIIRELFDIFLKASEIVGIKDDLYFQVEKARHCLIPFQIGNDGELKEWSHDYPEKDRQHRHISHLLALFPFAQITPEKTPELAKAARITIEKRMTPQENWEDTGWARSMLMLFAGRLKDASSAYTHIQSMLQHLTNPNLMIKHPPTRGAPSFADVYELDGNTGLTTCIAELLLQSHNGEIELLPALPSAWSTGFVKGLCARGGITVDMEWAQGALTQAQITTKENTEVIIRYQKETQRIKTEAGKVYRFDRIGV